MLQEIRVIFTEVRDQGFKNMKSWESHWDRQLYKVLEVKYIQGMVKVHDSLPEIHVELVYRYEHVFIMITRIGRVHFLKPGPIFQAAKTAV